MSTTSLEERIQWWKEHLSGLAALTLPTDYARTTQYVQDEQVLEPSNTICNLILRLSLEGDSTPFTVVLSIFCVLLHKWTYEEDIVVGSSSGTSNPITMRLNLSDTDTFKEVIKKVKEEEALSEAHEIPYADLVSSLTSPDSKSSLCQVRFFNVVDVNADTLKSLGGCDWTVFVEQVPDAKRILPLRIRVAYNGLLFSTNKMKEMLNQIQYVTEQVVHKSDIKVGDISLLTNYSKEVIPNPAAPLDNGWPGPIHQIFNTNSLKDPQRTAIVYVDQRYTYGEINSLSNRMANWLIHKAHVQKNQVVGIYAHRSPALVIAIMSILKAGGTICIVDPAYPPQRQICYLEVAQPHALIILEAAGTLQNEVTEYLKNHISTENIFTGLSMNMLKDLGPLEGYKDEMPQIEIGPDDVCTLGFTSGSTGIPKGVRGRHTSLTHFYPWMSEQFGLSKFDRFTMLSGIAHDPIQRDVFTPLFFGAQIRIPTAEDIGTPGQLAKWCAIHEVTVTHLTPAMGQLLTANATELMPSLRNAFFVGDVLTQRDVVRLQALAPKVTIINMYGTTETQRAVSYVEIKPGTSMHRQKEILPAGVGMKDVQLLVLTPSLNMAGIGEAGEIFVRSYHLTHGYLGLDADTKAKFIVNPFNSSDIQDRLYRTGDVGRYMADGVVECVGRADDQVKIRGFRVELREIDTFLVQHPQVREAVTLLRRDANEEHRLVAYFVPMSKDYNVQDLRTHLSQKLPHYAIPSYFVPLASMPLTPNGKIDKAKLPFPNTAQQRANITSETSMTPMQKKLHEIWCRVLGTSDLKLDDNFFEVGGHSVMATRLLFEMRSSLQLLNLPLGLLFEHPTLSSIADAIEAMDLPLGEEGANDSEPPKKKAKIQHTETSTVDLQAELSNLINLPESQPVFHVSHPKYVFNANIRSIFLTGATGFLGSFLLSEILVRLPKVKVYCLVRKSSDSMKRIHDALSRTLIKLPEGWADRVCIVNGDLIEERFGLTEVEFNKLSEDVDLIIHNGALVHWVFPYARLRAANVLSTIWTLRLAVQHHLKPVHFVSSTSVLDTNHYVAMGVVPEDVSLDPAAAGLNVGYGQSKWISEKLIMKAHAVGIPSSIIRPGYIVGHSKNGVTNTDDFLWRLIKGCVQLGYVPRMKNAVNMCPVDYVSSCVLQISQRQESFGKVFHMANPHNFSFDNFFSQLPLYGWSVQAVDYLEWRDRLMNHAGTEQDSALFPLLHFVLDDLPTRSRAPLLSATNTQEAIEGTDIICPHIAKVMGLYLSNLVKAGFLPPPTNKGERNLPVVAGAASVMGRTTH